MCIKGKEAKKEKRKRKSQHNPGGGLGEDAAKVRSIFVC